MSPRNSAELDHELDEGQVLVPYLDGDDALSVIPVEAAHFLPPGAARVVGRGGVAAAVGHGGEEELDEQAPFI